MLKEVKECELDGDTAGLPKLLWVLMQVPLGKKHMLSNAKKCIGANMDADNYGIVKKTAALCEDGESVFVDELERCDDRGGSDESDFAKTCSGGEITFCWSTHSLIEASTATTRCSYCPATFTDTSPGGTCAFCSYGIIES